MYQRCKLIVFIICVALTIIVIDIDFDRHGVIVIRYVWGGPRRR